MSDYIITYSSDDGTCWFEAPDVSIVALTINELESDPKYTSIRAVSVSGEEFLSANRLQSGSWSINLNNDFDNEEIRKFINNL